MDGSRTAEHNPGERRGDQRPVRRWWIEHRGYRDLWMFVITLLVVWSLLGIQDSRKDAVHIQCVEQNERNDGTVAVLDLQLAREAGATRGELAAVRDGILTVSTVYQRRVNPLPPGPKRDRLLRSLESREFVVFLIDALVPKRDCDRRVRELVGNELVG